MPGPATTTDPSATPRFAAYEPLAPRRTPTLVRIRAARASDVAAVLRVQRLASRAADPDALERAVDAADRCVLVAGLASVGGGEEIVGWAQTWRHERRTDSAPTGHHLAGLTVAPEHRRLGAGLALTSARLAWIAERADEAYCVVNARNRASVDLHRRLGLHEVLRAAVLAGVTFSGGVGLLLRADLGARRGSR